ncbi:hypothetical protein Hdeb2414_s0003g00102951 [Helianthus debilis subsp. tardiflorus]
MSMHLCFLLSVTSVSYSLLDCSCLSTSFVGLFCDISVCSVSMCACI